MRYKITWFLLCFPIFLWAQEKRWILANEAGNPIALAVVSFSLGDVGQTVTTDSNGVFTLPQQVKTVQLSFLNIHQTIDFEKFNADYLIRNDTLFCKKLAVFLPQTMLSSVRVYSPYPTGSLQLQNFGSQSAEDVLNRTAGVVVIGRQVSIRGGSGYSLGAASRTSLLVDGMPLLQPYSGDIRWNLLPLENLNLGVQWMPTRGMIPSGSINGVLSAVSDTNTRSSLSENFRKPNTFRVFHTIYGNPPAGVLRTWPGRNPWNSGLDFRNVLWNRNGLKLITYGQMLRDEGYRESEFSYRFRGGFNANYHRVWNRHTVDVTLRGFGMRDSTALFFFWESDSTAYKVPATSFKPTVIRTHYFDPEIRWTSPNQKHELWQRNRIFYTGNWQKYHELIYKNILLKQEKSEIDWSTGILQQFTDADSVWGRSRGAWAEVNASRKGEWGKWVASGSVRWENYENQRKKPVSKTIFRGKILWETPKKWQVQLAGGQSWRAPNLIETDITTVGGSFGLFPNPYLRPESAVGYDLKVASPYSGLGNFSISQFICSYNNLIDLQYGIFFPANFDSTKTYTLADFVGARNENIASARISGWVAEGRWRVYQRGKTSLEFFADYTYALPLNLNKLNDSVQRILKYRIQHLAHFNVQAEFFQHWKLYWSTRYTSQIQHIDGELERFVPGIKEMRTEQKMGNIWSDLQVSYHGKSETRLGQGDGWETSFFIRNLWNTKFMPIPGNLSAPRSYGIQVRYFW